MKNKILIPLIMVLGLGGMAEAQQQQQPARHIRYVDGDTANDGELQVEVTRFRNQAGIEVTLYGVVHIADQSYFAQIQRDLATYDTVLYEGVKQGTRPNTETKGLNAIQKLMATVLGFQFQKDGIDYNQRNFVHADIDIDTLQRNMKGKSLNPLEQYFDPATTERLAPFMELASQFVKAYMDSNPELRNRLRKQMAQSLAGTDISAQLPPDMKKAIIDDRNQIVMNVLADQLQKHPSKKKIAIFYGAGHNPDFVQRLQRLGYTQQGSRWMTAWRMGRGASRVR